MEGSILEEIGYDCQELFKILNGAERFAHFTAADKKSEEMTQTVMFINEVFETSHRFVHLYKKLQPLAKGEFNPEKLDALLDGLSEINIVLKYSLIEHFQENEDNFHTYFGLLAQGLPKQGDDPTK